MNKLLITILCMLPVCLFSQEIDKAAGIRLGHTSGVTYKKFVAEKEAVEVILSGRNEGMQANALYEFHLPLEIGLEKDFHFYYGIGGHVGFERFDDLNKIIVSEDPVQFVFEDKSYFTMGVDLIAGVEYRYLSVPMTIGLEIKPYFNFIGMRYTEAQFWDIGFSFKYVF